MGNGTALQISKTGSLSLSNNLNLQRTCVVLSRCSCEFIIYLKLLSRQWLLLSTDFFWHCYRVRVRIDCIQFAFQNTHKINSISSLPFLESRRPFQIWHNQLGHLAMHLVQQLLKNHHLQWLVSCQTPLFVSLVNLPRASNYHFLICLVLAKVVLKLFVLIMYGHLLFHL